MADLRHDLPELRPRERFWPYGELAEDLTDEELARLDSDLREVLYPQREARPFSVTLVFSSPPADASGRPRALQLARGATEYRQTGEGAGVRHRARFEPSQANELRELFDLVGADPSCEVLIDDRPIPYARELWLPLLWFFVTR